MKTHFTFLTDDTDVELTF